MKEKRNIPIPMNLQMFAEEGEVDVTPTETEATEAEPTTTEQPFSFKIQYNKEDVEITDQEKLRELAQKGMNYDKLQAKLEEASKDPLKSWASEYMKEVGFDDPNKFIEAVKKEREQAEYSKAVEEYRNKGYDEEVAKELINMKREAAETKKQLAELQQKSEEAKQNEEFVNWYDEKHKAGVFKDALDVSKIPSEVWAKVKDGTSLKSAYMEYQLDNLKTSTEQEVISKMAERKESTTGSVKDTTQPEEAELTMETILANKDDKAWIAKNFDRIEKSGYFKNL